MWPYPSPTGNPLFQRQGLLHLFSGSIFAAGPWFWCYADPACPLPVSPVGFQAVFSSRPVVGQRIRPRAFWEHFGKSPGRTSRQVFSKKSSQYLCCENSLSSAWIISHGVNNDKRYYWTYQVLNTEPTVISPRGMRSGDRRVISKISRNSIIGWCWLYYQYKNQC